ncbi:hypothetical protein B7O87_00575 [Cylindrospermopsis raciborskii CENA303]|uniref:DUF2993 domain-containing protein n=1 Tax=Cylindrospermopsis raciborskii CENA303 TaxID=1170769 RepID=A0A1X4GJC6_9CYAN|nr:DUF2993 domain-containing protein [Cylindrospermopsis raciborskii]OSO97299.1 hypothetical protein B7O87_00575 [Cylindrospermopsis raciborskii CENA303]
MTERTSDEEKSSKTRIVTRILNAAIKLWLRSQLSQVYELEIGVDTDDQQLLSGRIPKVSILATKAVYQGIHITRVQLTAQDIHINFGSVLRGQPLRLLSVVPVFGELLINELELNSSLSSPLLSHAINETVLKTIPELGKKYQSIFWNEIALHNQGFVLQGVTQSAGQSESLEVHAKLQLVSGQEIKLTLYKGMYSSWQTEKGEIGYIEECLHLGSDVDLEELILESGQISCRGKINVNP